MGVVRASARRIKALECSRATLGPAAPSQADARCGGGLTNDRIPPADSVEKRPSGRPY